MWDDANRRKSQCAAVSIVIPCYNSATTILDCVEACLAQEYPRDRFEVIVVDDGSTDNTAHILSGYPVKYIHQRNAGPASARNTGWRVAKGEIVCFTDADCLPEPTWLKRLTSGYSAQAVVGMGGSYGIANEGNLLAEVVHEEIVHRHVLMPDEVDFLGSFNVSYKREVLEELGGFDEGFTMASGEDNDLSYRVKKAGYRLRFSADCRVMHRHPEQPLNYLRRQFWHGYWRMKLYRKHPDMMKGDVYSGPVDHIQPPLCLLTVAILPFSFLAPVALALAGLLVLNLLLQLPVPIAIVSRTGRPRHLILAPLTFVRSYARSLGMAVGLLRFFLLPTFRKGESNGIS